VHPRSDDHNYLYRNVRTYGSIASGSLNFFFFLLMAFRHLKLTSVQGRGKDSERCWQGSMLKVPSRHFPGVTTKTEAGVCKVYSPLVINELRGKRIVQRNNHYFWKTKMSELPMQG